MIKKYALIAVTGFFLLGGCGNAVGNPGGSASLSEDSAAETAGSAVEEEAVSWEYLGYEEGILQIKMTNNTDGEIVYSDDHELYQDLGGRWEHVPLHTGSYLLVFYLEPQSSIPLEYEYKSIYKLSRGKYKFEKNYDTPDGETHVLEILRQSGYRKTDIRDSEECRSAFENDRVVTFEILTCGKKYFFSVTLAKPYCLAFGGNHYITDRGIYTELIHTGGLSEKSVDFPDRGDTDMDEMVERADMLSEFYLNGASEEILAVIYWNQGNPYKLTDDPQTIQWFLEALDPDHLPKAEDEDWFEGKGPQMTLAMVAGRKKYFFHVNEPYVSTGFKLLVDDGSICRKIRELGGWDLE